MQFPEEHPPVHEAEHAPVQLLAQAVFAQAPPHPPTQAVAHFMVQADPHTDLQEI